jgi:hypothetical protein
MNCEMAQEDIVLSVYGELPDDRAHWLDQHLAHCERCREEMESVVALRRAMSAVPLPEPSASLLARTRVHLDEALDAMPQGGFLRSLAQRFRRGIGSLQGAPVMAMALLLAGLGAGAWGGYRTGVRAAHITPPDTTQTASSVPVIGDIDASQVAGVSSIVLEPGSENVEVRFSRTIPETAFGTLDDPQIRQLLLMAAHNRANPVVHDDSVNLLAQECRNGHQCTGGPIRGALMVALRYDRNAGVRRKALEGLQAYIPIDMKVRDAVLEALLHDSDAQVRAEAITLLEPVAADSAVRDVLETVASQDQNQHIRTVSRQYLEQVSQQIQ